MMLVVGMVQLIHVSLAKPGLAAEPGKGSLGSLDMETAASRLSRRRFGFHW